MDNKQLRYEQATESLQSATKMLARFDGMPIAPTDLPRIEDVATQAAQAAQQLQQLVGILLAEAERLN